MNNECLEKRRVRYDELIACKNAFIDTRSPGSDKKENFTIIGPGVSENPDQHIHISIPHGFNIGAARQPPKCLNSQHSHLTEEVFIVHSGKWAFFSGVDGTDGRVVLEEGDIISLPTDIFRGFENVGDDTGLIFAILGSDNPGRVTWAPHVFDMAKNYGLVLLENGALVDTNLGQKIPNNVKPMPVTSASDVARHRKVTSADIQSMVINIADFEWSNNTALSSFKGVQEVSLIGNENSVERIVAGKLHWPHGFVVRALTMRSGAMVPPHKRFEEEVVFVLKGELKIDVDERSIVLARGDTFTTPIGAIRSFINDDEADALFYVTRRGDSPQAPEFL